MYRVGVAPRVLVEVATIERWWRKHRPAAPDLFLRELETAVAALAEYPERGRPVRLARFPDARSYVLPRSRYVVLYNVMPPDVIIVRVRHANRRPLRTKRR